ncbi:MAG: NAD-dependent protein deacylase [Clostridiales bacterium]|nr:NAD-dependent protein deacylase [Clostridiales bacterium]
MTIEEYKEKLGKANRIVFFGGAGVSTESGIPDFRSVDGLYNQKYSYPPEIMLSADFFYAHTDEFYRFYFDKMIYTDAKPNAAHIKLAEWEKTGKLKAVVTQNIDGLHQKAGSKTVYELHGSVHRNRCIYCGKKFGLDELLKQKPSVPRCECGGIIKPDVVLYGEGLPERTVAAAIEAIASADMLIVGGTSLAVYPAAGFIGYYNGSPENLIVINKTPIQGFKNQLIGTLGELL